MTDPDKCKHPLKYKVANDIRMYCPDCGKFLYGYIIGCDTGTDDDHMVVARIHPDGTVEQIDRKFLRNLVDDVWNFVTESEEVPSTPLADKLIDKSVKNYQKDLEV